MITAFLFAIAFTVALTVLVRATGLAVRSESPQRLALSLTASFVGLAILAWWFVTRGGPSERMVHYTVLPSPVEVFTSFPRLHLEQGLVRSIVRSLVRVNLGFALGALIALPLGVYMATFSPIAAFFRPLALASAYVPTVVFIPLTIGWWGTEEVQKIGFLGIACFVSLLPLVIKSIADVPAAFLDVAVTKGATQWQLVRHVLFPVAKADIWDHMRGVYGVGWGWIIMAEIINSDVGLGSLLNVCDKRDKPGYFAVLIVIVLLAVVCDQGWRLGARWLFPWRQRS